MMTEVGEQKPIQMTVLDRERTIWTRNAFNRYTPETPSPQYDFIEERMVYIGPHRITASFHLVKPDETASMMRRASVAILENSIEKHEKQEKGKETVEGDSTASLKEALIKNPSVIQLLNPQGKSGSPNMSFAKPKTIVFTFKENNEDGVYFRLPSMTAVGKIDDSTRLLCQLNRQVNGNSFDCQVTIIIKDASTRLHDLLLESIRDPTKLCADLPKTHIPDMIVYKECAVKFEPPVGLDEENFWPVEKAEPAAPPKPKKPKLTTKPVKTPSSTLVKKEDEQGDNMSMAMKQCAHCGSKGTPQWRRGPDGAGTLCNACGVKWKHGKLSLSRKNDEIDVVKDEPTPLQEKTSVPSVISTAAPVKETFIPLKKRKFLQSSYSSRVSSTDEIQTVEVKDVKPDTINEHTES